MNSVIYQTNYSLDSLCNFGQSAKMSSKLRKQTCNTQCDWLYFGEFQVNPGYLHKDFIFAQTLFCLKVLKLLKLLNKKKRLSVLSFLKFLRFLNFGTKRNTPIEKLVTDM